MAIGGMYSTGRSRRNGIHQLNDVDDDVPRYVRAWSIILKTAGKVPYVKPLFLHGNVATSVYRLTCKQMSQVANFPYVEEMKLCWQKLAESFLTADLKIAGSIRMSGNDN